MPEFPMKFFFAAMLAALLLVAACGESQEIAATDVPEASSADTLKALLDEHFQRNLELNPLSATFIGDYRYNDRLANSNSPEYIAELIAMDEAFLARLLEIDREQLDYQDQLSYDLFKINREQSLEGKQFPSHLQPVNQFYSTTNFFVQLGSGSGAHPFKTVKDYDDFLSRAEQFAINIDQIITNMQEGMRQGVTQPRILMEKLVPQIDTHIVDDVRESYFYKPVRNMPQDFGDDEPFRPISESVISWGMSTSPQHAKRLGSTHSPRVLNGMPTWCVCVPRPTCRPRRSTRSDLMRWHVFMKKFLALWTKSVSMAASRNFSSSLIPTSGFFTMKLRS
jgi:hypothetical protein